MSCCSIKMTPMDLQTLLTYSDNYVLKVSTARGNFKAGETYPIDEIPHSVVIWLINNNYGKLEKGNNRKHLKNSDSTSERHSEPDKVSLPKTRTKTGTTRKRRKKTKTSGDEGDKKSGGSKTTTSRKPRKPRVEETVQELTLSEILDSVGVEDVTT